MFGNSVVAERLAASQEGFSCRTDRWKTYIGKPPFEISRMGRKDKGLSKTTKKRLRFSGLQAEIRTLVFSKAIWS
jgi:hypothetical protein